MKRNRCWVNLQNRLPPNQPRSWYTVQPAPFFVETPLGKNSQHPESSRSSAGRAKTVQHHSFHPTEEVDWPRKARKGCSLAQFAHTCTSLSPSVYDTPKSDRDRDRRTKRNPESDIPDSIAAHKNYGSFNPLIVAAGTLMPSLELSKLFNRLGHHAVT